MSKPYVNINSASYSNNILTLNLSNYKTRGALPITIDGFSSSLSYTLAGVNSPITGLETVTYSARTLGTNSTAVYTDPSSLYFTFGGTPSTTSNVKITVAGTQVCNVTSAGSSLTTLLNSVSSSITNTITSVVSSSGNISSLVFTTPNSGSMYNGLTVSMNITKGSGGSTLTYSVTPTIYPYTINSAYYTGTFSGGNTTYSLSISLPQFGYTNNTNTFNY